MTKKENVTLRFLGKNVRFVMLPTVGRGTLELTIVIFSFFS